MRDLQEIRQDIDRVDGDLVKLFQERMELCREVAEYKIDTKKRVLDPKREAEKLEKVMALADSEFNRQCVGELFTQLIAMSRKMQYKMLAEHGLSSGFGFSEVKELKRDGIVVVYQGVEGAYSHQAMLQYFGDKTENFHVKTFRDAMEAIRDGKADYAVLPIENSSAGSVYDV